MDFTMKFIYICFIIVFFNHSPLPLLYPMHITLLAVCLPFSLWAPIREYVLKHIPQNKPYLESEEI